jgi:hypothetical protein
MIKGGLSSDLPFSDLGVMGKGKITSIMKWKF